MTMRTEHLESMNANFQNHPHSRCTLDTET
jgi:hypothetical protein